MPRCIPCKAHAGDSLNFFTSRQYDTHIDHVVIVSLYYKARKLTAHPNALIKKTSTLDMFG